ncbi:MAG: hypothetical protein ACE5G2_01235 [Candidatus Krumholzibacteriia bacterium]
MNARDANELPEAVPAHLSADDCLDLLHGLSARTRVDALLKHAGRCESCETRLRTFVMHFEELRAGPRPVRQPDGTLSMVVPDVDDTVPAASDAGLRASTGSARSPGPSLAFLHAFRPRAPLTAWAGVAAALVLVAAFLLRERDAAVEIPPYWIPAGGESVTQRSDAARPLDESFRRGIEAYEGRDAAAAVAHLRVARVEGPHELLRVVYLASALTLIGRADEAASLLETLVPADLPEPWRTEAQWIHALALAQTDRREDARRLLERLSTTDGEIGGRARKLLVELAERTTPEHRTESERARAAPCCRTAGTWEHVARPPHSSLATKTGFTLSRH